MNRQIVHPWDTLFIERRLLRWLLFFYCLFILYGAFIPFRFDPNPGFVQAQWSRFFAVPFIHGDGTISAPDVVANILFLFPFGLLWIGAEILRRPSGGPHRASLSALVLGSMVGLLIEIGQTFFPGRTASILDALCNGVGSGLGGLVGCYLFRALRGTLGTILIQTIQQQPSLVLFALLCAAPLFDAFYPFHITLDISTVWHNVKQARWIPFIGELRRPLLDLVVEKALLFAALGFLAYQFLCCDKKRGSRTLAWIGCSALALAIEGGKLFFVGRSPSADNFLLSLLGAWVGVLCLPALVQARVFQRRPRMSLLTAFLGVNCYMALSPFDWVGSVSEAQARLARIEWLPFFAYYGANPLSALFDLAKKLFLIGPIGFLIAYRPERGIGPGHKNRVIVMGLALGLLLETIQILLRSRSPAVTDVALFGLASWLGAAAFERYQRIRTLRIDNQVKPLRP